MPEVLFKETQKFRQKILWIFLIIVCTGTIGLFGIAFFRQIIFGEQFGDKSMSDTAVIIAFIMALIFAVILIGIFYTLRLETVITEKAIKYRFWPLIRKQKVLPFEDIKRVDIEKYKPIMEFGGWGYRFSFKGHGIALNTKGNKGLRIEMKNGFKILIGTQKPDEIEKILDKILSEYKNESAG